MYIIRLCSGVRGPTRNSGRHFCRKNRRAQTISLPRAVACVSITGLRDCADPKGARLLFDRTGRTPRVRNKFEKRGEPGRIRGARYTDPCLLAHDRRPVIFDPNETRTQPERNQLCVYAYRPMAFDAQHGRSYGGSAWWCLRILRGRKLYERIHSRLQRERTRVQRACAA